jgi:dienelactone hydrolase
MQFALKALAPIWVVLLACQLARGDDIPKDFAGRTEAIPIQTLTISDEQFLKGDSYGAPTTIAGILRIAQGAGKHPLVILLPGSGGDGGGNIERWSRIFLEKGVSTFEIDSFSGRGIVNTVFDQSKMGRLNGILDLYRGLSVVAAHPWVDATRIAVMGFSRGGEYAVYSSVRRFQRMWNLGGIDPAAYIGLYPPCTTTYIGDTDVSDHPIRMFHGTTDDYVEAAPCRTYESRLRQAGKDIENIEFPDVWHSYDGAAYPSTPLLVKGAETTHCEIKEQPEGVLTNTATQSPLTRADACISHDGAHIAYSASATLSTETALNVLLTSIFKLK